MIGTRAIGLKRELGGAEPRSQQACAFCRRNGVRPGLGISGQNCRPQRKLLPANPYSRSDPHAAANPFPLPLRIRFVSGYTSAHDAALRLVDASGASGRGGLGAWKGVAWQVASLGSVLVSTAVAVRYSAAVAPFSVRDSCGEPGNWWIAMLVLYLAAAGGVWILFRLVSNLIDRVRLKEFDRQLGAVSVWPRECSTA